MQTPGKTSRECIIISADHDRYAPDRTDVGFKGRVGLTDYDIHPHTELQDSKAVNIEANWHHIQGKLVYVVCNSDANNCNLEIFEKIGRMQGVATVVILRYSSEIGTKANAYEVSNIAAKLNSDRIALYYDNVLIHKSDNAIDLISRWSKYDKSTAKAGAECSPIPTALAAFGAIASTTLFLLSCKAEPHFFLEDIAKARIALYATLGGIAAVLAIIVFMVKDCKFDNYGVVEGTAFGFMLGLAIGLSTCAVLGVEEVTVDGIEMYRLNMIIILSATLLGAIIGAACGEMQVPEGPCLSTS